MAIYYPTSNNQRDAAPMLYLREPLPTSYSEAPIIPNNMMMYVNYSSTNSDSLGGNSHQQTHCIEFPSGGNSNSTEILSNLRDTEMLFTNPIGGPTGFQGGQNLQGQGLSLSLSTQIPSGVQIPSIQYRNSTQEIPEIIKRDSSTYPMSTVARTIPNSKYLKATQLLLDEVVNMRSALKKNEIKSSKEIEEGLKDGVELPSGVTASGTSNPPESTSNWTSELSPAERQDLQNKLTKLLSMLDEVDRRYKQYYHQMQIVVSSFDVIAGCGAAKPYTALALQTISRHFRCLRDAIMGQIRATRKNLGEQENSSNGQGGGISRLRFVDQQLRQQRALQQLGMMQPHAWRPQRGLPESSVSILRAWLFEHFLHPYPKDSDKIMLARQTGLTRSQVSNWFINARVRLWKPMVEEMYKEETGDAELDSNSSSEPAPRRTTKNGASEDRGGEDLQQSSSSAAAQMGSNTTGKTPSTKSDAEMTIIPSGGPNFQNGPLKETETGYGESTLFEDGIVHPDGSSSDRFIATAAAYHMAELGRFGGAGSGNGGGVSLTLGLQQCEGGVQFGLRGDIYDEGPMEMGPEQGDFDCLDPGSRQHRFGSSHMLHDFVA